MLIIWRKEKSSAPRCRTPDSGSGRINAPHGTELISLIEGIKNARNKYWRAFSPESHVRQYKDENVFSIKQMNCYFSN